jgi:hypothetical protein
LFTTPGWTTTSRSAGDTSRTASIRVMTTVIAPSTALLEPASPEPAPRGTTGIPCRWASRITATTSAVERGKTTAAGTPAGASIAWSRA